MKGNEEDKGSPVKGGGKGGAPDLGKSLGQCAGAWSNNPTGFGYQGISYDCGKVGHKAYECPDNNLRMLEEGGWGSGEAPIANLSSVWNIYIIEQIPSPKPLADTTLRTRVERKVGFCDPEHRGCGCRQKNSFGELSREEEEGEDEEEKVVDYPTLAEDHEEMSGVDDVDCDACAWSESGMCDLCSGEFEEM